MKPPFKSLQLKHKLLFFALFISLHSFAQNYVSSEPVVQKYPSVKFGYIDAASLTVDQILGNPKLTGKDANCEVIGYTLVISRGNKDFYGPYTINGSALPENIQKLIRNLDVLKGKMYFEQIRVKYNGKEITLPDDYILKYYH